MIEIIDVDSNVKMMALIICGIKYGDNEYVMYSVKRDNVNDNIFVSKVVKNSMGYTMSNDFSGGEKGALDGVVNDILNKNSVIELSNSGVEIIKDVNLGNVNKFSISLCYVTTYKRILIKELMVNYGLLDTNYVKAVVREKEESYFSKGNISTVLVIGLGIVILIFCISIIVGVL